MSVHIMLDLETWGTRPGDIIVSIGAVKFDGVNILDRFHVGIDPKTAEAVGLKSQASTLEWWLDDERAEARKAWHALEKVDIAVALDGFGMWYTEGEESPGQTPVWGNGSTFDNVLLRAAYGACGMTYPAPFYLDWCYRSVKSQRPDIRLERVGVHHSAVDDAESQARHLQKLAGSMGFVL